MKKLTLLSLVIGALTVVPPSRAADLSTVIATTAGRQANFVQKFTPRGFKKEQVERGVVVFGAAPQMRWTYSGADAKVFVFDGTTSWLYTPSDRQVIVTRLSAAEKRSVPLAFLWDPAASSDFQITEGKDGRNRVLNLRPRGADSQIRSAQVITLPNGTLQSLSWTDRQGNRNVFEFSSFKPASTRPDTFRFSAPSGTNVVQN